MAMSGMPKGFRYLAQPFALRNYQLYVAGNVAANIAVWMQRMGVGWLTWELTGSAAWLGIMALAEAIPALVFTLFAGTIIDRVNFFRLLKAAQFLIFLYALALALITMTGLMTVWILMGLTVLRGFFGAFYRPARMTLIYSIVGKDLLPAALSFNSMIFNASRFVGPAMGGVIIILLDIAWVFVVTAVLYGIYSLILFAFDIDGSPTKQEKKSLLGDTLAGLKYIIEQPAIRYQMAIILAAALLARPLTDLFPGFAGAVFERGADGLAWFLTAHGIGAVLGSFYLATRSKGLEGMTRLTLISIFFISATLFGFSIAPSFYIAVFFVFAIGFFTIIQNISNQTLIQSNVDQAFRGRVLSIYGVTQQGIPALGALIMGVTAEYTGLRVPVMASAIIFMLICFLVWPRRKFLAERMES